MTRRFSRKLELHRLQQRLERFGWPRLEMSTLVLFTALSGFFVSGLLLSLGWTTLWSRWLVALAIAYGLFLGLLGVWLHWRRDIQDLDAPDPSSVDMHHHPDTMNPFGGHGGHSAGGGASAGFDAPGADGAADAGGAPDGIGDGVGDALGSAFDADAAAIPLLLIGVVLAIACGVLFASVWLITSAPTLFAEVMLDALLAAGLYRRLRASPEGHWLESALRHTLWPFLVTAIVLTVAGFVIQHFAPEAHTLGEAFAFWRD